MMEKQLAFFFDASSCSGCKTCQVACKDKNDLPLGIRWRRVYEVSGGDWTREGEAWVPEICSWHVSLACNHCVEPICMKVCPNQAISKDDRGVVRIDPGKCMGCHYCEWSCPYGALLFDPGRKVMTKCDFCHDHLERGDPPACVAACPARALDFGELSVLKEKHGDNAEVFPLPARTHTDPALVVKPHPGSVGLQKSSIDIENIEEVR